MVLLTRMQAMAERFQAQGQVPSVDVPTRSGPFELVAGPVPDLTVRLLLVSPAEKERSRVLWSWAFADADERAAFLRADVAHPTVAGRIAVMFGAKALDGEAGRIASEVKAAKAAAAAKQEARERDRLIVRLYAPDRGRRFYLELERVSDSKPEWSVEFDRRLDRDRLLDWLRWQRERFLEFLDQARVEGPGAVRARMLAEMFATERRVKSLGESAGGSRPLALWQGE